MKNFKKIAMVLATGFMFLGTTHAMANERIIRTSTNPNTYQTFTRAEFVRGWGAYDFVYNGNRYTAGQFFDTHSGENQGVGHFVNLGFQRLTLDGVEIRIPQYVRAVNGVIQTAEEVITQPVVPQTLAVQVPIQQPQVTQELVQQPLVQPTEPAVVVPLPENNQLINIPGYGFREINAETIKLLERTMNDILLERVGGRVGSVPIITSAEIMRTGRYMARDFYHNKPYEWIVNGLYSATGSNVRARRHYLELAYSVISDVRGAMPGTLLLNSSDTHNFENRLNRLLDSYTANLSRNLPARRGEVRHKAISLYLTPSGGIQANFMFTHRIPS